MLFKSYLKYSRLSVTWGSTKSKSSIKCEDNKNVFVYSTRVSEEMVTMIT